MSTHKPLNGEKTHPLSPFAQSVLISLRSGPIPRSDLNPGIVDRLLREGCTEIADLPSPYRTHKGKLIPHLRLIEGAAEAPTPLRQGGNGTRRALAALYPGRCAPLGQIGAGWQCCRCRSWVPSDQGACVCGHDRCGPVDALGEAVAPSPAQKPRRQHCPGSGKTIRLQGLQIACRKAPCPECQALRPIAPEPDRTAVLPTHMRTTTTEETR